MLDKLSDYDFDLPAQAIAQHPVHPREAARLLYLKASQIEDKTIADLPDILRPNDLLIVNNTRVIPAQLFGFRGAGRIGFTLHKRISEDIWQAFAKPAKKCTPGTIIQFADGFHAEILDKADSGIVDLHFNLSGPELDQQIEKTGQMPLPPYIKRPTGSKDSDYQDYQTVFARHAGAVAAPTAGLHFTEKLRARIKDRNIGFAEVTLHVGAGTFLPVKTDLIHQHRMHSEWGNIPEQTVQAIQQARHSGGRIISVGTTSLRILEAAFQKFGKLTPFSGETDIFITPGFQFGVVDMLLTNFHLPRSTLLMLVSAFSGHDAIMAAYQHALNSGYRFFSYGDACLLNCQNKADQS